MKYTWNRRNTALLLEHIEMYVSAGLTLHDALKAIESASSRKQKKSLRRVSVSVEQGHLLSSGLAQHIQLPPTIVALIEHAEYSGTLPKALGLARMILEREDQLLRSCLSSLTYPIVIALFAGMLTIGLMQGVMPQIIPMLKSLHISLPVLTQVVIYISEHVVSHGLYICAGIICTGSVALFAYKKFAAFKLLVQQAYIRIPIAGNLFRLYYLSLFARSLGGLISSGTQITDAYERVIGKINMLPLRRYFLARLERVQQGSPLSIIVADIKGIPAYVRPLVSAGEISGTLGTSLMRVADIIDRDIEHSLKRLTSLIEPVMMICIGSVIGAIALSIMMPIYEVSKILQH
ncbi:MAG: type II secretion system F family protein [Patescibacteria group bacterium]